MILLPQAPPGCWAQQEPFPAQPAHWVKILHLGSAAIFFLPTVCLLPVLPPGWSLPEPLQRDRFALTGSQGVFPHYQISSCICASLLGHRSDLFTQHSCGLLLGALRTWRLKGKDSIFLGNNNLYCFPWSPFPQLVQRHVSLTMFYPWN